MQIPERFENRHPATIAVFQFFAFDHLPEPLKTMSMYFYHLAMALIRDLPDCPELTVALRKLLESKDCAVRTAAAYGTNFEDTGNASNN